ncbi:hypothetical protein C8J57DRAFT_1349612 [Mycena rebaudengoi]|nr:hypothetical protein C8J57DRAFT_1349612 [Mycena rebaudengoi]
MSARSYSLPVRIWAASRIDTLRTPCRLLSLVRRTSRRYCNLDRVAGPATNIQHVIDGRVAHGRAFRSRRPFIRHLPPPFPTAPPSIAPPTHVSHPPSPPYNPANPADWGRPYVSGAPAYAPRPLAGDASFFHTLIPAPSHACGAQRSRPHTRHSLNEIWA